MTLGRYCYTREIAAVLGVDHTRAWRILRDAGVQPLGRERAVGALCVWRTADVTPVLQRYLTTSRAERRREANIRCGIARRALKRRLQDAVTVRPCGGHR